MWHHITETITGTEFLEQYGSHIDPATPILPDHVYHVRSNTRYAVLENNRVALFSHLLRSCDGESKIQVYEQLGEF